MDVRCKGCDRRPDEIQEYIDYAGVEKTTPEKYVCSEEGTFNRLTGKFLCTTCYIKAGMPLGKA